MLTYLIQTFGLKTLNYLKLQLLLKSQLLYYISTNILNTAVIKYAQIKLNRIWKNKTISNISGGNYGMNIDAIVKCLSDRLYTFI